MDLRAAVEVWKKIRESTINEDASTILDAIVASMKDKTKAIHDKMYVKIQSDGKYKVGDCEEGEIICCEAYEEVCDKVVERLRKSSELIEVDKGPKDKFADISTTYFNICIALKH